MAKWIIFVSFLTVYNASHVFFVSSKSWLWLKTKLIKEVELFQIFEKLWHTYHELKYFEMIWNFNLDITR